MFRYSNCDICGSLTDHYILRGINTYNCCIKDSCNDEIEKKIINELFKCKSFTYSIKGENKVIINEGEGYFNCDFFNKLYFKEDFLIPINYYRKTLDESKYILSSKYYKLDELLKLNFNLNLILLDDISIYLDDNNKKEFNSIKNLIYKKTYFNRCVQCLFIIYKRNDNCFSILPNELFLKIINEHLFS